VIITGGELILHFVDLVNLPRLRTEWQSSFRRIVIKTFGFSSAFQVASLFSKLFLGFQLILRVFTSLSLFHIMTFLARSNSEFSVTSKSLANINKILIRQQACRSSIYEIKLLCRTISASNRFGFDLSAIYDRVLSFVSLAFLSARRPIKMSIWKLYKCSVSTFVSNKK